jgi:hypothetical protein
MSKLFPILYELKTDNKLYFINDDGRYNFKNVVFFLTSMFNNCVTPIFGDNKKINIGLYHGTLKNISSTKHKYTNSGNFHSSDFDIYNFSLLGDIHKRQNIDKCFYSGSLLQLDPSCEIQKGGYLFDLKNDTQTPFNLKNNTGYCKLIINENGSIIYNKNKDILPENIKLIVECNNLDENILSSYLTQIKNTHNIVDKKMLYMIGNRINFEAYINNDSYNIEIYGRYALKYYNMVGDHADSSVIKIYNPRINLNKITTKLLLPDGSLFNFGSAFTNDTSNTVISVSFRISTIQRNLATQYLDKATH